jgi:hypothetical protein
MILNEILFVVDNKIRQNLNESTAVFLYAIKLQILKRENGRKVELGKFTSFLTHQQCLSQLRLDWQ